MMWRHGWRDAVWDNLDQYWDLIIIGGGITGAGILREASRAGLKALLLEAHDFASGTSSRSSKLVHGGFRYLKNLQLRLTLQSVRERERLLTEGRGLINPLSFLLVNYQGDSIPAWVFEAGLVVYDLLALKWGHRHYDEIDMRDLCPALTGDGLLGGFRYFDAQTDDARLVLRVIQESLTDHAQALNYARVIDLLHSKNGQVRGVVVEDQSPEGQLRTQEIQCSVVINATGAWADELRGLVGGRSRLRKLRGSHLVFSLNRLPISRSISFLHPIDQRPVFAFPWEGVAIIGTTDVDNDGPLRTDVSISEREVEYLLQAVQYGFSCQELGEKDILSTYSGVRPVVDTNKQDPSKESREHVIWNDSGLLTVTGGKLTTFRLMAHDTLERIRSKLAGNPIFDPDQRVLASPTQDLAGVESLNPSQRLRILGRFGRLAQDFIYSVGHDELKPIADTISFWGELRWAARNEGVIHLDDLLLRRVRLGLLLPSGGQKLLEQIRAVIQPELGWDNERWDFEADRYSQLWKRCYHLNN
jgi:glycerol-3-phosphate dehydrogenase